MYISGHFVVFAVLFALISADRKAGCNFGGQNFKESQVWLHQSFFNVTCIDGIVKVINCVTSRGTRLPLGTHNFQEDGFNYKCKLRARTTNEPVIPSTTPQLSTEIPTVSEDGTEIADECDNGKSEYVREGYMVSCVTNEILGCVDINNDLVREGYYVLSKGRLRSCHIYGNGRRVKSDFKGCFNGTRDDDPSRTEFHVLKGHIWRNGDYQWKCGDEGFFLYKCHVGQSLIHTGTAWIDKDNVFNICK
ncbi:abnormal cell migration protein 18 [Ditylenchus destructor]|uniref:Abnormal cell migration protein 18 n=1 Tax=Ditylenchus destructor TaxID=166010 RepID=A0AAD4NA87_9BILA|nr:abnormal cell migration protein 18 [Ditylenchus destructor]